MSAKKEKAIKLKLAKDSKLDVKFKTTKQKPYVKPTAEQISAVQSARTIGGDVFQTNMSKLLRGYGVGKTPLIIPHMVFDPKVMTHKPSASGKKSIYDFHDAVNNIVYEMCQSASDGKAAKIEGDVISVKIYNPDMKYVAVVEVEKTSEKYRKNRASYALVEEVADVVCYGEAEFRNYLRQTYTKNNYYEGKLVDVDVDDVDMLEINRDINDRWVQSLVDYILTFGFITNIVVVPYETKEGKIRYKIIDGNHRFMAKKQLIADGIFPMGRDGSVNRNKIQVLNLDWIDGNNTKLVHQICIQMNMTNKSWAVIDYIESFLKYFKLEGLTEEAKDYQLLSDIYRKYDNAMVPLYITVNTGLRNYDDGMGKVKEGKWICDKQIHTHITTPLLELYGDIKGDSKSYGEYTNTALQWLLTFIKVEMIERLDDYSYHKLIAYFVDRLQSGAYKKYRDVDDIREKLIPMLKEEFAANFPIGEPEVNPSNFKFKTARKTIEHFAD
jgi:hypothetical protein